jgi:serine/threonine protein kinase
VTGLSDGAIERLRTRANWPELPNGRYVVTREIGRGGMGTVFAAMDTLLNREVALKVTNAAAGGALEARLSGEAQVLAALEHPGIVPVHDVGRLVDGRGYYVMKLVHGRSLREVLAEPGHLSDRLGIVERIVDAVAFAHARGVLHRDLKSDNVMIGPFGDVIVTDWGVAQVRGPAGRDDGLVVGTPGYMAPEQARGDAVDERADVYSLGAILQEMIARETTVPRPLRSMCARAMADDPADRYPSAAALAEEIARFRAGRAVLAHRESLLERGSRLAHVYQTPILLVLAYMIMRALVALATSVH